MNNKLIIKTLFISLLTSFCLQAFSQNTKKDTTLIKLKNEIELLKKDKVFKHASWSICVMSQKTGKTVAEYNSEMALTPASTMKIFTTATALSVLGGNYKFESKLEYSGKIDSNGTLHGNVYINGGGDPTIGSDRFNSTNADVVLNEWIEKIKSKGIKKIDGKVIADAKIFDNQLVSPEWTWEDIGNYYGTGACGLSIYENQYHIYFKAGNFTGDSAKIESIYPEIPFLELTNNVKTGKSNSGDNVIIYGSPYSNGRILEGTVPLGKSNYSVEGSIPDPSFFFAYYLNKKMLENGIAITQLPTTLRIMKLNKETIDTARVLIANYFSPNLESIVYYTNLKSVNTFAEHMLKMMGAKKKGEGSFDAGAKVVGDFLSSKKIDIAGFNMNDGSGLSPLDKVTTKQMAGFLLQFINDPAYEAFYNSLPIAGKSGSIASLFKGTVAENNLRAKSGFLSSVRAFAGYVKNKSNDMLSFSIIVNNYDCKPLEMKSKLENLMLLIAELE